ncbi:MAG: GNAT family N-acetyltransferase, partial [Spirochaetaceae bacterium]|nr:GNAT family N-acetyltransferase [Spirochaetaceae bacterium]
MILLDKKQYSKVVEFLQSVTINNLFARSVVEQKVSGKIFVDNTDNPQTFYVLHPYGMSLLFGDWTNTEFNNRFKAYALDGHNSRSHIEWMQTFPDEWNDTLFDLLGDKLIPSDGNTTDIGVVELNTRVNFKFNRETYMNRQKLDTSQVEIRQTDAHAYHNMPGTVVPKYFWDSGTDFFEQGIGFSLFYNTQLASMAFSSYIHDDKLEIGIETAPQFRKKGYAEMVCSAMIEYCIANAYEPVWSCRLENTGSYMLAQKLGFEPTTNKPYYR